MPETVSNEDQKELRFVCHRIRHILSIKLILVESHLTPFYSQNQFHVFVYNGFNLLFSIAYA